MELSLTKQLDDVKREMARRKVARVPCPCKVFTIRGHMPCEDKQECPTVVAVGR